MADPKRTNRGVVEFALRLPEAHEDHPWEETVVKVGRKIFVFLGNEESSTWPSMSIKLRDSLDQALSLPGAVPTGYGLGRAGWVTIPLIGKGPPLGVCTDLVEESYRLVAPKRLVARLEELATG